MMMINKVILVFKTHFDIGFTDLADKVLAWYAGPMLEDVLKTCEDTADMGDQRFVWTMPAMPLFEMLKRNEGENRQRLEQLVRERQIVWHALPFTSHTDFCGVEDLIRGFSYSEDLCRRFHLPRPLTAKMSDVPGHGRILPTILHKAGIRFLHLGSNEFAMSPDLPTLFFWEGPDGSRILTMYSPHGYSAAEPPKEWLYPVWMSFHHTHDNFGPQTAESLRAIVKATKEKAPGAQVVSGTMEDFYQEIIRCDLSRLPVIRADLADTWIHGAGTYPEEVAAVRKSRRLAVELEAALALLGKQPEWNGERAKGEIADVYEALERFGEHTWGLDVKTWLPAAIRVYEKEEFLNAKATESYQYMERSWEEQRYHAAHAEQLLRELEGRMKAELGSGKKTVLNANGSHFTGWARAGCEAAKDSMELFGENYFYVEDVPPLTIEDLPSASWEVPETLLSGETESLLTVENHRYRITVTKAIGRVEEVYDKQLQKPLLAARGDKGVFDYRYDKYGSDSVECYLTDFCQTPSDWGVKDNGRENYPVSEREVFYPAFTGWEIREQALILSYQGTGGEHYGDAGEIRLVLTLPKQGEEFFVELLLQDKQESPYIESGSLLFPFACEAPGYRFNKNGQLLDPATDIADNANHALYALESFATMSQGGHGVCIVTRDTPLTAIGETGIYTFRKSYEEHEPVLYFDLFNNMWGTNFPQWMGGNYRFCYTLFGYKEPENITAKALRLYQGASVVDLPAVENPVYLPEGIQVSAFLPGDNGGILRLRDTLGISRKMVIGCKKKGTALQECDLLGQPMGAVSLDCLKLLMEPYGISSVIYTEPKEDGGCI